MSAIDKKKRSDENLPRFSVWQILLVAILVTPILYLCVFRHLFAGPEVAVCESLNIAILAVFLWKKKAFRDAYSTYAVAKAQWCIIGYTGIQTALTVYTMNRFNVGPYTYLELLLHIIAFAVIRGILSIPAKAST